MEFFKETIKLIKIQQKLFDDIFEIYNKGIEYHDNLIEHSKNISSEIIDRYYVIQYINSGVNSLYNRLISTIEKNLKEHFNSYYSIKIEEVINSTIFKDLTASKSYINLLEEINKSVISVYGDVDPQKNKLINIVNEFRKVVDGSNFILKIKNKITITNITSISTYHGSEYFYNKEKYGNDIYKNLREYIIPILNFYGSNDFTSQLDMEITSKNQNVYQIKKVDFLKKIKTPYLNGIKMVRCLGSKGKVQITFKNEKIKKDFLLNVLGYHTMAKANPDYAKAISINSFLDA